MEISWNSLWRILGFAIFSYILFSGAKIFLALFASIVISAGLDFIVDFLERLNPNFVVERFTGEAPPWFLAVPAWGNLRTDQLLNLLEKKLEYRNTWQGRLFKID